MTVDALPLQQLCDLAITAARAAGHYIQSVDQEKIQRQYKNAGDSAASQVVTEIDLHSEAIIRQQLEQSCTAWGIAFVGEESCQAAADELSARLSATHFWCVDPLDGTLPFVEGKPGYAVSIALVEQSGNPLVGVVYDPVAGTVMHAIRGQGAFSDGVAISLGEKPSRQLKVFADASFDSQADHETAVSALERCAIKVGLEGVDIVYGSGAVKNACQVLDYPAACYVKLPRAGQGGGSIWDFAATACILPEAGGWASNIFGDALDLNRRDSTFMNHQGVVFASSEQIARYLIGGLSPLVDGASP